ncbi:MAG: hypothetical protein IBJ07_05775 [Rhizobiaceae bacterium]|nr:hypothetical protein [Rhizobiaceae bacterium]
MKIYLVLVAALTASTPSFAQDWTVQAELPFEISVAGVDEVEQNGLTFTVVTAKIVNGEHFTNSLSIYCEAENEGGHTWDVVGIALSLSPNETRSVRLVSSNGDDTGYYGKPTKGRCEVAAFDGGLR